jgi:hypothetical protein
MEQIQVILAPDALRLQVQVGIPSGNITSQISRISQHTSAYGVALLLFDTLPLRAASLAVLVSLQASEFTANQFSITYGSITSFTGSGHDRTPDMLSGGSMADYRSDVIHLTRDTVIQTSHLGHRFVTTFRPPGMSTELQSVVILNGVIIEGHHAQTKK